MDSINIEGVMLTPLKRIANPKGDILHCLKSSAPGFAGFGEAYFSTIHQGDIKGWKKHQRMTLNLVVPVGKIKFVMYNDRKGSKTKGQFQAAELSPDNYQRLTIAPGLWIGFQGLGPDTNLLLNIADIEHDPDEALSKALEEINYNWD